MNEYIYNYTEEEEKILQSLGTSVKKSLKNKPIIPIGMKDKAIIFLYLLISKSFATDWE